MPDAAYQYMSQTTVIWKNMMNDIYKFIAGSSQVDEQTGVCKEPVNRNVKPLIEIIIEAAKEQKKEEAEENRRKKEHCDLQSQGERSY